MPREALTGSHAFFTQGRRSLSDTSAELQALGLKSKYLRGRTSPDSNQDLFFGLKFDSKKGVWRRDGK